MARGSADDASESMPLANFVPASRGPPVQTETFVLEKRTIRVQSVDSPLRSSNNAQAQAALEQQLLATQKQLAQSEQLAHKAGAALLQHQEQFREAAGRFEIEAAAGVLDRD